MRLQWQDQQFLRGDVLGGGDHERGLLQCRHVVGGRLKHFSKHPVRYWMWGQVSKLNTRHKTYAWITLGTLMLTDFYIMLVASGTISDLRFVG